MKNFRLVTGVRLRSRPQAKRFLHMLAKAWIADRFAKRQTLSSQPKKQNLKQNALRITLS